MALDSVGGIGRRNYPPPMLGFAEKGCKTGCGIEPRQTQPVDRPVATDERGRAAIADQRVLFDTQRGYFAAVTSAVVTGEALLPQALRM